MLNWIGSALVTVGVASIVLGMGPMGNYNSRVLAQTKSKCTPDVTASCSTCTTTGGVYQCDPDPLNPGEFYGVCFQDFIARCVALSVTTCQGINSPYSDYDCSTPKKPILASKICLSKVPQICK